MISFFKHQFKLCRKKGGPGEITEWVNITRSNPGDNPVVRLVLTGFDISFYNDDHPLHRVFVEPLVDGPGPFREYVPIKVKMGIRDHSNSWDDDFEGSVELGIIVIDDDQIVTEEGKVSLSAQGEGPKIEKDYPQHHSPVYTTLALLKGFDMEFENDDHPVHLIMGKVDIQNLPTEGTYYDIVQCTLGLRDLSGHWDDRYRGSIYYTLLRFPNGIITTDDGEITLSAVDKGPEIGEIDQLFNGKLRRENIFVGLKGFSLSFPYNEQKIHRLVSSLSWEDETIENKNTRIKIYYKGGIRDHSGNWDDAYMCEAEYTTIGIKSPQDTDIAIFLNKLNKKKEIALQTHNGHYLCAEGGGGGQVLADRTKIDIWETFELIDLGNNNAAFKAHNGQYLCAEGGGGKEIVANRDKLDIWETFKLIDLGNGNIAIRTHNGHYLCAEGGGGKEIVANRDKVDIWETFKLHQVRGE